MIKNQTTEIAESNTKAAAYASNPFKLIKPSYQSLIGLNAGTSLRFTLLTILNTFLAIGSFSVIFVYSLSLAYNDQLSTDLFNPNNIKIFKMLLLAILIFVFSSAMTQIQTTKIALAAANKKAITFKEVFTTSFKRIPAVAGLYAILVAVAFIVARLSGLAYASSIELGSNLALVSIIAFVYLMVREAFAIYFVVQNGLGPIKALRASWRLSAKNFIETAGATAVGGLIAMAILSIDVVAQAINQGADGVGLGANILIMLIFIPLSLLTSTIIATRFFQFLDIKEGKSQKPALSKFNIIAVTVLIGFWIISNMLLVQATKDSLLLR